MKEKRVLVVLSGGGAKAAAHVGALKALFELGITPSHYVGTSMGAVIGACFAAGLTYQETLKRITAVTRSDVAALAPQLLLGPLTPSLLRAAPLRETIAELVPASHFEDLPTPLTVTAVDSESGELVLFGSGGRPHIALVDALYASCALPVYYPPGRIGDRTYIDGGMRAVLPIDVAMDLVPDAIFAVHTGPSLNAEPPSKPTRMPRLLRAHGQAIRILMATQAEETIRRARTLDVPLVIVQPQQRQQATFAVEEVVRYVEEGYRAASRDLEPWRSAATPTASGPS